VNAPSALAAREQARSQRGLRQSSLRDANLELVTRTVFESIIPLSRADVSALTGMTRSTVSRLVDDLVAAGILAELEPVAARGPGRPAVPLTPASRTISALGIEVNVAHVAVRQVDLAGEVIAERYVEGVFAGRDANAVLDEVGAIVREVLDEGSAVRVVAAHIALPGLVDVARGMLLRAPNLGWSQVRPANVLEEVLGRIPLSVGNEADYAARTVAEVAPGRPGEHGSFIYISGEVGIGASVVTNGRVAAGTHGFAGEIGHVTVDPEGSLCGCGAQGCLEAYAGQAAILAAADAGDVHELAARLEAGDEQAQAAVAAAGRALGIALSGVVNMLDISTVVIGGHLAELSCCVLDPVRDELAARVLAAEFIQPEVFVGTSDHAPSALGAAYAGLHEVLSEPARWVPAGD